MECIGIGDTSLTLFERPRFLRRLSPIRMSIMSVLGSSVLLVGLIVVGESVSSVLLVGLLVVGEGISSVLFVVLSVMVSLKIFVTFCSAVVTLSIVAFVRSDVALDVVVVGAVVVAAPSRGTHFLMTSQWVSPFVYSVILKCKEC